MIVLGLTGSIGMGKSTAARLMRRMGVPVHDSDAAVHDAMQGNGSAFADIVFAFPDALAADKKAIDRQKLGGIVFKDEKSKTRLENIIHPRVRQSQKDFLRKAKAAGSRVAVLDIPLLFETGAEDRVDAVITVTAPFAVQKRRVLARQNMTEDKFMRILANQMPDLQKRNRSDFVVQTGLGYAHTAAHLRKILREIRQRHA